jgi:hypothetical protein
MTVASENERNLVRMELGLWHFPHDSVSIAVFFSRMLVYS